MHKYLQLLNDLEVLIESRPYKEGDKLPSIRALAQQYHCSKSTVIRAMDELEKRHMIYSIAKSGYYVVKRMNGKKMEGPPTIDFASSAPDPDVFPYLDFQHCINKAIDTYKNDLFIYGMPKGLTSLIHVVQQQLANYQVFTSKHNIFITSGVQQALSLLAAIPFPNLKTKIVIEQPAYHLFIEHLETHKIPTIGIRRTAAGIDMQELERIFRTEDVKFFYTIPRFHNPLGTSYTKEEKMKIAELAQKYDVYIVEDDQMADMELDSKADPIYSYDTSSHVIYLKSYSKIIFPGLRIGVAVISDALVDVFNQYKKLNDIDSSMLSQGALEIYLKSGMFERHTQKIRSSYARRAEILAATLEQQSAVSGGIFAYHPTKHPCIHTHILLEKRVSLTQIIAKLKKQSILLEPIDKHYLSFFPKEKMLKLNVSNVKEDEIERGIVQVIEEIKKGT